MTRYMSVGTVCIGHILTFGHAMPETSAEDVLDTWQTGIGEQPAPDSGPAYVLVTTVFAIYAQART